MEQPSARQTAPPKPARRPRYVRRDRSDNIQKWRFAAQLFSTAVSLWIGVQFYLWTKKLEGAALWSWVPRPPGVEGWLPIGAIVSLRYWIESHVFNYVHPAGLVIFLFILGSSWLFKKAFCSWVCPVGFISEMLGDFSKRFLRLRIRPWKVLDWPLRMIKYLLLGFFVWAILIQMTPASIEAFVYSNYNQVADILMLRFFTDISRFALAVTGALVLLSLVVRGFWCRYLCPYGALLGLIGLISPTRIRRNETTCIDCARCAKACPAFIKVDKVKYVVSDECVGCMACVDSCPVKDALTVHMFTKKRPVNKRYWALALVVLFWVGLAGFKLFGPWENNISDAQYREHLPRLERGEYVHPR
ncbi:MAG TPA: 4Fe-4S binding protein [candidate division Zixibacteria bacterium]|nr:4Fe-4S binding protein [candidate division Zixibacteria bacterium]MDM7972237.1 4Fe-4S binding protein [candidate division Zixibacteria bacterium]HOD66354.1 4Fe-4S binding protein [candidate division Zixibacteria bacterium]HPI32621.1 4Fe-4S binding protein [candidate division Zixibacteria bacterium]HPM35965.1 4Fe-4S binding protein [candidate division Zixibacteria bacterium]